VRVEDTREDEGGGTVHVAVAVEPGRNVREPGEDVRAGTTLLRAGTALGPVELGVAVTARHGSVACVRRPRIGVLATGDELVAPGATLRPGEIHNSNEPMLAGLAERAGAVVTVRGRIPDDRARTEADLADALEASDLLVVSGGVSVGPHDHVKPALAALGVEERFWRVALQPGKPTWFGTRGDRFVFGLPGNPVSAAVCFTLFAAPALRALQGREPLPARRTARLEPPVRRRSDREQAIRVRLAEGDGGLVATANGPQGSHVLTSLLGADALAFVPAGEGAADAAEVEALGA
jgi:molybdopterin molybdotransferase